MQIAAGQRVAARGLVWDVCGVEPAGAQTRLRLRCAAGDLRGLTWTLLTPHEPVTPLATALDPARVQPLAQWRLHHMACLLDQVPGAGTLLAAAPGRVALEPYQLVPMLRALELPRPRLLLADGVGLGKTIEAGLIATELIARRRAHRILVVAPAGPLLRQWEQELRLRFDLRFQPITHAAALEAERRVRERGGNPFDAVPLCLTALDFAKQEHVLQELERTAWDLVIIDEAHHCVGAAASRDVTQRRRLAEVLARTGDGLLLLTATPHDGDDAHFGSLLALLDPSLVDAAGLPDGTAYRRHVVRRLKQHLRDRRTGAPLFRARQVVPVAIAMPHPAVRRFHAALSALVLPRLAARGGEALAFVALLKRSVSTIAACVATLRVVAARLGQGDAAEARERARALHAYRRKLARYGVLPAADEAELAALEAEDIAARLSGGEATALQGLIALGEAAAAHDPKLAGLVAAVRAIRADRPRANVLVYTEYADSQDAACAALRAAGIGGEVLAISGADDEAARTAAAERCASMDDVILVSTDSLAEGLNLHRRCRDLIHLDLPYNPNRLEQRNGRIDRYGQVAEPLIRYLYLADTFEEALLLRLIGKYEKARAALTFMPDTLGQPAAEPDDAFAEAQAALSPGPEGSPIPPGSGWFARRPDGRMDQALAEPQASLFPDPRAAMPTLDRSAEASQAAAFRDLLREIDRAYDGFERMALRHGWLAGQGLQADAARLETAERAVRRSRVVAAGVDLAGFVRAALAIEQGEVPSTAPSRCLDAQPPTRARDAAPRPRRAHGEPPARRLDIEPPAPAATPGEQGLVRVPAAWAPDLAGLAGWDPARGTLDPTEIGRAHPLVRRCIDRMRQAEPVVAVIRSDGGVEAVVTYAASLHAGSVLAWQRVLAVRLRPDAPPAVLHDAAAWFDTAAADGAATRRRAAATAEAPATVWERHFAGWATRRLPEAEHAVRTAAMQLADRVRAEREAAAAAEAGALETWLRHRAAALCGPVQPRLADLFAAPAAPDWRTDPDPLRRLGLFAADPAATPAQRQAANEVLALARARSEARQRRLAWETLQLSPIGLLLRGPA